MDASTLKSSLLVAIPLAPLIGALIHLVLGRWLERVFGRWIAYTVVAILAVLVALLVSASLVSTLQPSLLVVIPLAPLIGALINLVFGRWLERVFGRWIIHTVAILAVVVAFIVSASLVFGPLLQAFHDGRGGVGLTQLVYTWIEVGAFKAQLAFRLDTLSAVMILIVTFVGSLIHIYSAGYMAHDPRYSAFFGYLNLFTGSMLILVLAANLPVMFIGWEGVGLCSYLLIGFWFENESYATAGRKAFVVNRIGDFAFLLGMFLLFWATKGAGAGDGGSLDFATLRSAAAVGQQYTQPFWGGERLAAAAGILLFIGACGKSAQLPLFVWLPDAMAGPTPVSALIHAATMVTAGVYMVCRLSFLYASSTTAMIVVATVGLLTALAAAFMAFAQTDLKKVLAYSTVSQLGFMFVAAGTGNWVAAIFHLGTHAFFKACLFLGAGSVMHAMEHAGSAAPGDIMTMGGLRRRLAITHATFAISCLAIAGIPLFSGFFSKDEILAGAFAVHPPGWPAVYGKILWFGLLVAALGTAFYMWRLYFLVFGGDARSEPARHAHESPGSMTLPLVVLAIGAFVGGVLGLPHFEHLHLPHWLADWLKPSLTEDWYASGLAGSQAIEGHASDATIWVLLAAASLIAVAGIALARLCYGRGPSKTVERWTTRGWFADVYRASKAKLWFDEIYDVIIVRPFKVIAQFLLEFVDRFVVDTVAVNGSAFVIGIFGRISRWFQNGNVQRYLVGVVIGGALVFVITDCHHKATFEYKIVGNQIQLHADPGAGILGLTAKVYWDRDGDGKKDEDPDHPGQLLDKRDVTVTGYDGPITMWVDDPATGREVKVTRTINLNEGRTFWPPPEPEPAARPGRPADSQGVK